MSKRAPTDNETLMAFRMPSTADLEELRSVALQSSSSVSEFIRKAVRKALDEEQAKTA